ncbi:MAG TPA: non-homologous end-joining DNA ligase [Solirubrobacterales bacterium]
MDFVEPMLAKHVEKPPEGDEWAYEIKWDGVRAMAAVEGGELELHSRRAERMTRRYPELAAIGPATAGSDAMLDGEVVAFNEDGVPSFQLLQKRMGLTTESTIRQRVAEVPVTFIAFDLVQLDGRSLVDEPYERRRELLAGLGFDGPSWQAPAEHHGEGARLLQVARERGLEGIVAKRIGSPYCPGRRTDYWLKTRARRRQEFVIGGYNPGEGGRRGRIGSLLVGYWDSTPEEADRLGREQKLVYAGGVGTGFTEAMLDRLTRLLTPLVREIAPFELGEDPIAKTRYRPGGPAVFCEPELVCEVEFTEWTFEGTLRQPAFKGLRDDKDPREVVRES